MCVKSDAMRSNVLRPVLNWGFAKYTQKIIRVRWRNSQVLMRVRHLERRSATCLGVNRKVSSGTRSEMTA